MIRSQILADFLFTERAFHVANLMNKERCCDGFAVFISKWFRRSVFFPYALATIRLDYVLNPWNIPCGRQCVTRVSILNDFSRILRLPFTRFPPLDLLYFLT